MTAPAPARSSAGAAHEIRRALGVLLLGFAEQLHGDDPAENPRLTDELVGATVDKLVSTFTAPALSARHAPPWPPVRYRMDDERPGVTGKLTINGANGAASFYVTVSHYETGELGEVWIRAKKEGGMMGAVLDALATAISIGLQSGIPWEVFADKFRGLRFEPSGLTDDVDPARRFVSSPLDYIVRWVTDRRTAPGSKR